MRFQLLLLILAVGLVYRLWHIDFPVGGFQGWRQADTAAMARNFHGNGTSILYPQIDWGGNTPGYVETEFPLYPYTVSILYRILSPADWIGRALSILCALCTMVVLFLLVRRILDEHTALLTAAVYAILPLNVFYTRAFMPESMMLMFSVLGVYMFVRWLDSDSMLHLMLSILSIALAALLKIPALYLGLPLLYAAWTRFGRKTLLQWKLWLFTFLVFAVVAAWYYHAHQVFRASGLSFGIWFFGADKWGMVDPLLTLKFYNDIFFKSIAERHLTYPGFCLFLYGLFIRREKPLERIFDWWLVALLIFVVIVPVGHQVHEYYQLPFCIPAAVYIGKALRAFSLAGRRLLSSTQGKMRYAGIALCVVAIPVLSFLRVANFHRGEQPDSPIFRLGNAVQHATGQQDLIVAVSQGDPVYFYRSDRKGWHASPGVLDETFIDGRVSLGAKYIVGDKATFERTQTQEVLAWLLGRYPVLMDSSDFFIVGPLRP